MSQMIAEVYDAFRNAGAEDGHARAAATARAEHDRRYDELRDDVRTGDLALRDEIRRVDEKLTAHVSDVEQKLSTRIGDVEQKLGARIGDVEQKLNALDRRLTVLEWNVRLNSVLLVGLLLKLVVFA